MKFHKMAHYLLRDYLPYINNVFFLFCSFNSYKSEVKIYRHFYHVVGK